MKLLVPRAIFSNRCLLVSLSNLHPLVESASRRIRGLSSGVATPPHSGQPRGLEAAGSRVGGRSDSLVGVSKLFVVGVFVVGGPGSIESVSSPAMIVVG